MRAGKAGHLACLVRTLGENASASGKKKTGVMAWQRLGADYWSSSMVWPTLVVILGEVGSCVGPRLWQFSDGQPFIQGWLAARNRHELACTHFMPGRWVHNWGVVKGTGLAVFLVPVFLGTSCWQRHIRHSSIVRFRENFWNDFTPKDTLYIQEPIGTDIDDSPWQ